MFRKIVAIALLVAVVAAQYDANVALKALLYDKIAYCPPAGLQNWTCPACHYHPNFRIAGTFQAAKWDMLAYTGFDTETGNIVVAFRGSHNIKNWIADLDFIKTSYYCPGCEVHRGFLEVWQSIQAQIIPSVQSLIQQHPGAPLFVTGHSLGAAVSIHGALAMRSFGAQMTVYTFGLPRVGNPQFSTWAWSQLPAGNVFRVTHKRDPVPHVPPEKFGFVHVPHELWYDNNVGGNDYKNCNDSPTQEDPNCSDSVIPIDVDDHLFYMAMCTECTCDSHSCCGAFRKSQK